MITDSQTNFLYLSDCIKNELPNFWLTFEKIIAKSGIRYGFLNNTKEIWAQDFMPVQIGENNFVQFTYSPDYLWDDLEDQKNIISPDSIIKNLGIETTKSNLILEGGNVIKSNKHAIISSKIFVENPQYSENQLTTMLEQLLELDLVVIPWYKKRDPVGHANCWVRFLDDKTVLINHFHAKKNHFFSYARSVLRNMRFDIVEIPFAPTHRYTTDFDVEGLYINYLQMEKKIFVPQYNIASDEPAMRAIENIFTDCDLIVVPCNELAAGGGVLGCASWNVYQPPTSDNG